MIDDIKVREAIFEIFKSIRDKEELPHELLVGNNTFKFEMTFPSGIPIELFVDTVGEDEEIEYLSWCRSGVFTSCEIHSDNLDYGINSALWSLLENKFCNHKETLNPFDRR